METVTIYAKVRGRAPANLPRGTRVLEVESLDVVIPPLSPLCIGQRVRIHTLERRRNHDGSLAAGYTASPAEIEGRITGIRAMELAVTEFIVKNEDYRSTTDHAYLSIQHIHGVTVRLSLWHMALRTLLLPILPHTRHVPLERDTDVTPRSQT